MELLRHINGLCNSVVVLLRCRLQELLSLGNVVLLTLDADDDTIIYGGIDVDDDAYGDDSMVDEISEKNL